MDVNRYGYYKRIKEELLFDFKLKESNDNEQIIKEYIYYLNNQRPVYYLNYKTPTQFKTELGLSASFL